MSDCSVIQHDCTTADEVKERAALTIARRKASLLRLVPKPSTPSAEPTAVVKAPILLTVPGNTSYSVREIQRAICIEADISYNELISPRREMPIMGPRHAAYVLCILLTSKSLAGIGRRFGGRDHTTVRSSRIKMDALIQELRPLIDDVPLNYLAMIALPIARRLAKQKPKTYAIAR